MTVEKSLESIKGAKLAKKFADFGILKKFWEGAALRRFFIFQFFQVFFFLPWNSPQIFFPVQIGPIAHKISKIHHSGSPQSWEMGHFVKNWIFQFFWFSQKTSQNFQKIPIPSNSLVNFLHLPFSDHLSISNLKTSKLPLKSGTALRPLRFGHFWRFFRGFFHLLKNPLEIARKFKFHQIPWTISHFFASLTMSLAQNLVAQKCRQSQALCAHLPTVANPHYTVPALGTFCGQKSSFFRFNRHHSPVR